MSRRNPYQEDGDAALSLSPLIDAVFLLLIFFLVTTMLKRDLKEVEHIQLPVSRSSLEMPPDETSLVIAVDAEGDLFLDGEPSSITALLSELRVVEQNEPQRRVRIDTDEHAPFHRLAEVLDALNFRNLRNVGVRTYHERYN
ncbi:MAG: biopolymer transporter ExbD [Opitutales bacterium]